MDFYIVCGVTARRGGSIKEGGQCSRGELCIEQIRQGYSRAWCASKASLVEPLLARDINRPVVEIIGGPGPGPTQDFQVILTEPGELQKLYPAYQITLMPLDERRSILAQPVVCSSCSILTFPCTPIGTAGFEIHVIKRRAEDTAELHVFAWDAADSEACLIG